MKNNLPLILTVAGVLAVAATLYIIKAKQLEKKYREIDAVTATPAQAAFIIDNPNLK